MLLETPRLILRDFTADDWLAVFAYQRDPRYLRLYEWADRTPDEVRAFVQMFIDQQSQQPRTRFQLAVTLRQTGELIGNCGIRRDSPTSHEAEIGYELAPDQWGRGYASEAVAAIVGFGLATVARPPHHRLAGGRQRRLGPRAGEKRLPTGGASARQGDRSRGAIGTC